MTTTRTFKVSGLFFLAGVLLCSLGTNGLRALGVVTLVFASPVFAISLIRHLLRGILWRVGSRLFVSYLLLLSAVVLAGVFVYAGLLILAGQLGTRRVEAAFERRRAALEEMAHDLAPRLESTRDPAARARAFEEAVATSPESAEIGMIWWTKAGIVERAGAPAAPDLAPRPWMTTRASVLAKSGAEVFAAAIEPRPAGTLLLTLPLHSGLRREIERETGNVLRFHGAVHVTEGPAKPKKGNVTVSLNEGDRTRTASTNVLDAPDSGGEKAVAGETAAPPAGSGPWSARWTAFPLFLSERVVDRETGEPLDRRPFLILVQTSLERESRAVFGDRRVPDSKRIELSSVVLGVMSFLAISTVAVFAGASLIAALLVFRIARATRRLSTGFAEIEKGNFGHRAVLKGSDQLSALVASFNAMAAHLGESVAEKAEKEALERELSVARDLQRSLLPPPDFACPGIEIAVDFTPADAIGGDFYDLSYADRRLTVSVADVSGHGLSAGIVMAAARASLGMLARTGSHGVRLMELLHEEIVRTTERRTFVTLAQLVFDIGKGTVLYTNAGHPYPYRVKRDGVVEAVPNPARPLGLPLSGGWTTIEVPLQPGDSWVLFSDGLIEATKRDSDESWGFTRLEAALREGPAPSAAALMQRILAAQQAFTNRTDTEDDRTLLVLRVDAGAGGGSNPASGVSAGG